LPYDPKLPPAQQVEQSFQRSLEHLRLERIDSLVLHGPSQPRGLGDADREVWKAMESMQDAGLVRLLGVSNISPEQLESLVELATRTPAFVQNRCFAQRGWDALVRRICDQHDIVYQGFSLLTANQHVLGHPKVQAIAEHHGKTIPQVIFRFAMQLGMIPLTGTTDPAHMREDLGAFDFSLAEEEVNLIAEAGL
jgi:diketogulonate reductase-like aldo/keto reductase